MTYSLTRPDRLDLEAFARATGTHPELVRRLVVLGVLEAQRDAAGRLWFPRTELQVMARVQRLRAGFSPQLRRPRPRGAPAGPHRRTGGRPARPFPTHRRLVVDLNQLTQKSQEALHDAQTKALRFGHTEIDGEHLLLALIDQPEGLIPRLMLAADADPNRLREELEAELNRRPRVSGPGAEPGQVYVTQRLSRLLEAAKREADRLKDEYVSVEHLLIALIEEGNETAAGRLLHAAGSDQGQLPQGAHLDPG